MSAMPPWASRRTSSKLPRRVSRGSCGSKPLITCFTHQGPEWFQQSATPRNQPLAYQADSDRFAPLGNVVQKGTPAASIIAEEERLFGQVQARVALGDEDDDRPHIGSSDL